MRKAESMHWSHLETQILRMNYLLNEFIKEKKTMNIWRGHFQEFLSTSFNPKKHGFHSQLQSSNSQLQSSRSPSHSLRIFMVKIVGSGGEIDIISA